MDKASLAARALAAVRKGVLDRDQYMLTPKQRERYNQFRQQGIEDKVARQLAVAITKSERKPIGAAFARARAKQKDEGGSLEDHANEYLRSKGHKAIGKAVAALRVAKGGPGSGPQAAAIAGVKDRIAQLRAAGNHAAADKLRNRVTQLAAQTAAAALKKSYSRQFVASARDALPETYFNQLHSSARAKAGGTASGMARRAMADADKAQLMDRRKALKAELQQVEAQLAKTAPLAQEVAVDAPVKLAPKEQKRRDKLAERIAAQALQTVKSCPAGKEQVDVQVSGAVFKSVQPEWKRIVHSVVYAPGDVDAHGDYMHAEDIEKMAHDAMRSGLYVNHEHGPDAIEADIVESYIAPQDFNLELPSGEPYHIPKGAHVMAMHVWGDEPWSKIQKGEYVGYSLEGTALRDVV
jgi:hypothetical protein